MSCAPRQSIFLQSLFLSPSNGQGLVSAIKMAKMFATVFSMGYLCKVPESCWGSDPGSNLGKLPVSGLSGEFGSTCVVDGPNTWEATGGHGPGDVRVGWRMRIEELVA